ENTRHRATVTRWEREKQNRHPGLVLWFTGLSGSGKSTLACALERILHQQGCRTFVLDGDLMRQGLCRDLGFSMAEREENIRRIGEVARLFVEAGVIVLVAVISPGHAHRQQVKERVGQENFVEIYCCCPLALCEERDVKGLYKRARAGLIADFTGISSPYEAPQAADLVLDTGRDSIERCVAQLMAHVQPRIASRINFSIPLDSPP
ncbi:MAG: adenylyl-sulfate kinase, partial [Magnetococcales bacterium]|nr:adenylyl-sulfate kinase [Magnetococcales bacterium]